MPSLIEFPERSSFITEFQCLVILGVDNDGSVFEVIKVYEDIIAQLVKYTYFTLL
jgi:hypothetical protein